MSEKPPRIPPLALVRAINTVRAGVQRASRALAPGAINLLDLLIGAWVTQTLYVAVKLGIPDELANGPLAAPEVARRVDANPDAVHRLMRALASKGVLRHRRDGRFSLTSIGKALRTGTPGSQRDMALFLGHPLRWEDWGHLLHSVQTGEPAVAKLRGKPFFEYLNSDPELAESFNNAMTAGSEFAIYAVLAAYDFSGYRKIIDVGGGHGRLLSMILAKAPNARGVLYDLPSVVDGAGPEQTKAGVADRCGVWRVVLRLSAGRRRRLPHEGDHPRLERRRRREDSGQYSQRNRPQWKAAIAGKRSAGTCFVRHRHADRSRDARHGGRQGAHPQRVGESVGPRGLPA